MKTNLVETKAIFKMALDGKSFNEIYESSEFNFLEMIMGEHNALSWFEMYIELSTREDLEKYYNLPLFDSVR